MKIRHIVIMTLFWLYIPTMGMAQDGDESAARYINVRIQAVKPGKVAEWEELRREQRDGHREAGVGFYHVYRSVKGPWDTFLLITPATAIGKPGAPIAMAPDTTVAESWYGAISATLDHQEVVTLR
ncbi:MAG: antibiotic biosynthesis monooxygenase, partial [Gammaproteobacteria bacterium]|nr:antibiotic biosynthesis monooxygenase [Gammaproteobacteria bacterium]